MGLWDERKRRLKQTGEATQVWLSEAAARAASNQAKRKVAAAGGRPCSWGRRIEAWAAASGRRWGQRPAPPPNLQPSGSGCRRGRAGGAEAHEVGSCRQLLRSAARLKERSPRSA